MCGMVYLHSTTVQRVDRHLSSTKLVQYVDYVVKMFKKHSSENVCGDFECVVVKFSGEEVHVLTILVKTLTNNQ